MTPSYSATITVAGWDRAEAETAGGCQPVASDRQTADQAAAAALARHLVASETR
jgi:hypothetical protein